MDCSPPSFSVHGKNTGVAIPFFKGSFQARDWTPVSCFAGRFSRTAIIKYHRLGDLRQGFPGGASSKESTCQYRLDIRDADSIPGWERVPGAGHGNPLQYSSLENPMHRGAWQAALHRVSQSQISLKQLNTHTADLIEIYFSTIPKGRSLRSKYSQSWSEYCFLSL